MEMTNRYNLPEPVVNAIQRHEHKRGYISASEFPNSIKQIILKRRHQGEIITDASDHLYTIMGTAMHAFFEKHTGGAEESEQFLEVEVNGKKVTGTSDLYNPETKTITDYKNTSVWTIVYGSRNKDWSIQLNVYAWLLKQKGKDVENIKIECYLRDWNKKSSSGDNYPSIQWRTINLEVLDEKTVRSYIESKIDTLIKWESFPDNELPDCSNEHIWRQQDKWAVMKKGRKTAVRVLDTEELAREFLASNPDDSLSIDFRPGVASRCHLYCEYNKYCDQYKSLMEQNLVKIY
jgi:hypothetical protein